MKPYRKTVFKAAFLVCFLLFPAVQSLALGEKSYIHEQQESGDLTLSDHAHQATIYVDDQDYPGVLRAVRNLQQDITRVSNRLSIISHGSDDVRGDSIIIGTLGHSRLIDSLVAAGKLDVSDTQGQWDGFLMQVIDKPITGVERALVIVGADKRGTIYGTYDLSEEIGISPWYWWADVPIKKKESIYIAADTFKQQAPAIQYRGIFLNDESPALSNWVRENFGNYNADFYEHVFELLLRLKANFMWPAMWNNAFNADDPRNMILADEMGIVMSTSHHEPMMRAQKEWTWADDADKGNGQWDYNSNAETLREFWQHGIARNAPYESYITLGMRGDGDMPMSEQEDIALLERVVSDQRQIISDTLNKPLPEVPQVWTLYKEVQGYYERGMRVDDDITLLWSDDNWGQIRRLPTPEERLRTGGAGVYYHFDYVGGPRSYRWINTTPISKIWEQMNLAWHFDARRIWVVNVGDLKPMEFPIEYFLRLAWDPEAWPKERIDDYGRLWAEREFGQEHADSIWHLIQAYSRHNGRLKPELQNQYFYSLLQYREAERVVTELKNLVAEAEALQQRLPSEYHDAFFQLVLHPVKASSIMTELHYTVAQNHLFAEQGRASTAIMAERAKALFAADAALKAEYHALNDGKWNHFMSQSHIGYNNWNNPPEDLMPTLREVVLSGDNDSLGIMTEGHAEAWPDNPLQALRFEQYGQADRYIELFPRDAGSGAFQISSDNDWINYSVTQVNGDKDVRVTANIDWATLAPGTHQGSIIVRSNNQQDLKIPVIATKPVADLIEHTSSFIEADGYIAIEAKEAAQRPEVSGFQWQHIPLHGRTDSAISPMPVMPVPGSYDQSFSAFENAPYAEYDIVLTKAGAIDITALFSPTSPIVPGRGLRYAIAVDDEAPQVIDILANENLRSWEIAVSKAIREGTSSHQNLSAGKHRIRLYMVDTAVVLQKLLVDTGNLQDSYLGPEPSHQL